MEIFIEAESFDDKGGWIVDQQSMEVIHSSYIMAHGMGVPVADAVTKINIPEDGEYHIWALTRDWTAVWNVSEPAGKFKLIADGTATDAVLGTNGEKWAWQYAGKVSFKRGTHELRLHDLTGFNGRCDALYISDSPQKPSDKTEDIDMMRSRLTDNAAVDGGEYDLIVAGGGIAGICTALAALRSGSKVLLINDRGFLGGCNSSEIRVCMGGITNLPPYPNIGNVVKEIAPVMGDPAIFSEKYYEDDRKLFAFEASGGDYKIAFNECVTDAEMSGDCITAVITTNTLTGRKKRYTARLFADCTGDAALSRLAGAEVMYGREAADEFNETLAPKTHEKLVMGHSIRWCSEKTGPSEFPDIDWGMNFNDENCLNVYNGDWEQETGFRRDMIKEIEYIRDFGLRAIYSNWAYQKNHYSGKDAFKDYSLSWVSAIGGKRESYRVKGDYILTQNDLEEHTFHEDGTACITWSIDLHFPECDNDAEFDEPFRSWAYHRGISKPYPVPYRCLYSKDIKNLFLGGRIVSASHVAFSAIRVMRTLGQLGEVAGLAADICRKKSCLPRDVYEKYLDELKAAMTEGVHIPSAFCGLVRDEEAYHFKDIGWISFYPESYDGGNTEKIKRCIKQLGLKHKYPTPEKLK